MVKRACSIIPQTLCNVDTMAGAVGILLKGETDYSLLQQQFKTEWVNILG